MNVVARMAAALFAWNHAALMPEGSRGFAAHLRAVAIVTDGPSDSDSDTGALLR